MKKAGAKPAAKGGAKAPAKAPAKGGAAKGGAAAKKAPAPAPAPAPAAPKVLDVVEIGLKELPVVLTDSTGKIKESGRWPLVMDENGRVAVFLRHRDCNCLNALDSHEMEAESIRRALLGAIRYGKPMVINLVEMGSLSILEERFNAIQPDLWNLVLTKKILEDDLYMKLVRANDDSDYQHLFGVGEAFTLIFITASVDITEETKTKIIMFNVV